MEKLKQALRKLPFRTHRWIIAVSCVIGAILLWVGTYSGPGFIWMYIVGFVLLILCLIYSLLAIRCPHCDCYLSTRGGFPQYCPHCGEKLEK